MENAKYFSIISAVIIALIIIIYNKAIKDGQFTCNDFILNNYLYLTLAIMLVSIFVLQFEKIPLQDLSKKYLFVFLLSLISMIGLMFFNNIFASHLLWIIFLASIAYTLTPLVKILNRDKTLVKTLLSTFITLMLLSLFVYKYPEYVNLNMHSTLMVLLFSGIIVQLVNLIFNTQYSSTLNLILSYGFIVLFSLFILYDTKMLKIKAALCHAKGLSPNYPRDSLNLFLDILNLFTNYGSINRR